MGSPDRNFLKKAIVTIGVLGVLGGVGAIALNESGLLNGDSRNSKPIPALTESSIPTGTPTPTSTEFTWLTPTKPSLETFDAVKKACLAKVETMGHFNQHPELPMFNGKDAIDAVNWFRQYLVNYGENANDPVVKSLNEMGIKNYSDIMTVIDFQTFLTSSRNDDDQRGKKFVVYVSKAQDMQMNTESVVFGINGILGSEESYTVSASRLSEKIGLSYPAVGQVQANMDYFYKGQEKSSVVTFDSSAKRDVWPNGPLKGINRFVTFIPVGYEGNKITADTLNFDGAKTFMIDDFATTVVVNGETYVCPGSTNPISTKTPSPEVTPTATIPGETSVPTRTPSGRPTETPNIPPTATIQPAKPTSTKSFESPTPVRVPTDAPTALPTAPGPIPTSQPYPTKEPTTVPGIAPDNMQFNSYFDYWNNYFRNALTGR